MSRPQTGKKIVWLAAAEARGHLMRAFLMQQLLAAHGVQVDILTTRPAGVKYLRALGSDATLLPGGWGLVYDAHQNIDNAKTQRLVMAYLASVVRPWRDWQVIKAAMHGACLIVSDSMFTVLGRSTPYKVVQVYGENNLAAVESYSPPVFKTTIRAGMDAILAHMHRSAFAHVIHSLNPARARQAEHPHFYQLAPLCALPTRSKADIRAALGVSTHDYLAVVYLNPLFADPEIAHAIKTGLEQAGYVVHAVGEAYSALPGWHKRDPQLAEHVSAADLYISAAGMASIAQAHYFQTAYIAVVTEQPEQINNLSLLPHFVPRHSVLPLAQAFTPTALCALATALKPQQPCAVDPDNQQAIQKITAVQQQWRDTFLSLMEHASA